MLAHSDWQFLEKKYEYKYTLQIDPITPIFSDWIISAYSATNLKRRWTDITPQTITENSDKYKIEDIQDIKKFWDSSTSLKC